MLKVIEGKSINTEADFHAAIAEIFDLAAFYGRNLDALWDVMTGDVERPITLVWKNSKVSQAALGKIFDAIVDILRRVEQQDSALGFKERFKIKLE